MDNVLDLFDQTVFDGERATGATNLLQVVWVYNRAIDIDGLRRFHSHLQKGRLSRRIERSPLPFARHRWVSPDNDPELEIVPTPRPRDEFDAWLNEQANTGLDAEDGPGWHLAVLPFTDGGTGVSLVISHCLADGVGLCEALADAASGRRDPIAWPAARSRRLRRAMREDARQTVHDLPAIRRAVAAAIGLARRGNEAETSGAPSAAAPPVEFDEVVSLPTATVFVDADEWDSRAAALGGTANSLLAGLAGRIAVRAGRLSVDGSVALTLPVSERTADDTRANAITNIDITVDPHSAALDLRDIRATVKQALIRSKDVRNERFELLPIAPLLPQWLIRRCVGVSAGSASSVISSNLGVVDPAAYRPDGTDADQFVIRTLAPGVTKATMHRLGGLLVVLAGRTQGRVFVSVLAYQPGDANTNDDLRRNLSGALSDFLLTSTTGWACLRPVGAAQ
jgi:hypothetical protein